MGKILSALSAHRMRFSAAAILALLASQWPAIARSAPVWSGAKNCVVADIVIDYKRLADMAAQCESVSNTASLSLDQGVAAFNAARANNALADAQGAGAFDGYNKAKALLEKSVVFVSADRIYALQNDKKTKSAAAALRTGRPIEMARALLGLSQSSAAQVDYLGLASNELRNAGELSETDSLYDDFYFLRAKISRALKQNGSAREDLEKIVWRGRFNRLSEAETLLVQMYRDEGDEALRDPANAEKIRGAIRTLDRASKKTPPFRAPASIDLSLLLGRADLRLAQIESIGARENYAAANTAFEAAGKAAAAAGQVRLQADAYEGSGQALLGMSALAAAAGGADASSLKQAAIAAFANSAKLDPTLARKAALGMAYARAGDYASAETQLDAAMPNLGFDALMARAEAKRALKRPTLDVRKAYDAAASANRGSAKPQLKVGEMLFDDGAYSEAEARFANVIALPVSAQSTDTAYAYYYRSLIYSKKGRDAASAVAAQAAWKQAISDAEAAVRTGGGASPFKEQACLAHILRGGANFNAGSSGWCTGNESSEGALLLGMSQLKVAQTSLSGGVRSNALTSAILAFDKGLNGLRQAGAPLGLKPSFRSLDPGGVPPLRVLLEYGKAKAAACYGQPVVDTPLNQYEVTDGARFFGSYKVDQCTAG